jgi:hypothetical protein
VGQQIDDGDLPELLPTANLPNATTFYETVRIDDPAEDGSAGIYFRISQKGWLNIRNIYSIQKYIKVLIIWPIWPRKDCPKLWCQYYLK